jgi:23S rRNA pseudouridine1911/1915/1917 synthase
MAQCISLKIICFPEPYSNICDDMTVISDQLIKASKEHQGLRLDLFLVKKLSGISRSYIHRLIKEGQVTWQGASLKPSYQILGEESFLVKKPPILSSTIIPECISLTILFSDKHIAVIDKPAGLVVHPGAGISSGTLCNALLHWFPDMNIGDAIRPGIVHRLDKNTSGVMVVAKTQKAHQILSEAFKERQVKKIYRVFCEGELLESSFTLKTGHVRHPVNRLRFLTKIDPSRSDGNSRIRLAHTEFISLRRGFGITELKAILHTGRTHQIRAHLADIGYPLVKDELYGAKRICSASYPKEVIRAFEMLNGQALHAESLEFAHPITKENLSFTSQLPEALSTLHDFLKMAL